MMISRRFLAVSALGLTGCASTPAAVTTPAPAAAPAVVTAAAPTPPDRDYWVFVASEANDQIALVQFGPSGIHRERVSTVGMMPTDVDGPHGLAISPDGKWYYVSTAHGAPFGYLWKIATANDSVAGKVMLGNFPATAHVTPDGSFVYVVNFNLYGEMVPSSMSIVAADEMVEVARVQTCTMPHGSRINPQGTKQYSGCMMDDMAVEIDTRTLGVTRHFMLTKGKEMGMQGAPDVHKVMSAGHDMSHGAEPPKPGDVSCSPTWAQPSADGSKVFIACNKSSDVVELDVASWKMLRRMPAGDGVYNLAVTHDGRYIVGTNKRGKSTSVIDIATGKEVARIAASRRVPSGVTISSDDRYAFVTLEGVGSEPGTIEVLDLRSLTRVAAIDVGQQAGGIDFWKTTPPR